MRSDRRRSHRSSASADRQLQQQTQRTSPALGDLEARIGALRERWIERRQSRSTVSPYDRASSYLKREVYRLGLELDCSSGQSSRGNDPSALVRQLRVRLRPRSRGKSNVFAALISLVATDEELPRAEKLRYTQELQYARRHHVPVELLIGFIFQVGPDSIRRGARNPRKRESWYNGSRTLQWVTADE